MSTSGSLARRDLAQARAVGADLEDLPAARACRWTRRASRSASKCRSTSPTNSPALGLVERGQLAVGADRREHGDLVVVAVVAAGRSCPASSAAGRAGSALRRTEQQLVQPPERVQQRVGQQGLLPQRLQPHRDPDQGVVVRLGPGGRGRRSPASRPSPARSGTPGPWGSAAEGLHQVRDGQADRGEVGTLQGRHRVVDPRDLVELAGLGQAGGVLHAGGQGGGGGGPPASAGLDVPLGQDGEVAGGPVRRPDRVLSPPDPLRRPGRGSRGGPGPIGPRAPATSGRLGCSACRARVSK